MEQTEETFEIQLHINEGKIEFHPMNKAIAMGNVIVKDFKIENIKSISFTMDGDNSKLSVTVLQLPKARP